MSGRYVVGVLAEGEGEHAREAEVCQFGGAQLVEQDVAGLYVAVNEAAGVEVGQALHHLPEAALDLRLAQCPLLVEQRLLQVQVEVLEDQAQALLQAVARVNYFLELHDVGVVQRLQDRDFAQGSRRDAFVRVLELDHFDRDEVRGL